MEMQIATHRNVSWAAAKLQAFASFPAEIDRRSRFNSIPIELARRRQRDELETGPMIHRMRLIGPLQPPARGRIGGRFERSLSLTGVRAGQ